MDRLFILIQKLPLNRKTIYFSLLLCFFAPTLISFLFESTPFFFLVASVGATCGWFFLQLWEKKMQSSVNQILQSKMEKMSDVPTEKQVSNEREVQDLLQLLEKTKIGYEHQINLLQSSVAKSKDTVHQLSLEMDKKLEEMRLAYLEFEDLRRHYSRLEEEATCHKEEAEKNLQHKDSLLAEYQKTISEQRMVIEKKQRYVAKLEGKVRDLMYEIRSLLQLESAPGGEGGSGLDTVEQAIIDSFLVPKAATHTPYDFSVQLYKYVEKAENLTGVDHLGYVGGKSPRFLDPSLECYAIDRRRLFDCFKDEASVLFVYSSVEEKFLFINAKVKSLTGWSPEKFMKEFPKLVVQGFREWEEALTKIKTNKETSFRLAIVNKNGQTKTYLCYMGMISKGPFIQHIVGILVSQ